MEKEGDVVRIVKPIEQRRKEILDGAMKVFAEKGFAKTSIYDIAGSLNISQGLC